MAFSSNYVRVESEQVKEFYQPPVPLTAELPTKTRKLIEQLEAVREKFQPLTGWRIEAEALQQAAEVFAQAAHEVYGARLSVEDEDPTHLDAFLNRHLIAPDVRELFDGAQVKEGLQDADYERFAELINENRMPDSEALYYFLGAYWGEWLVRHRGAKWMLHPPLRTVQAFPDMITSGGTVGLMPFSQVVKKLADPVGDNLGYKASVFETDYLPPFPLIASMADSQEAVLSLLPQEARLAEEALEAGDVQGALALLEQGREKDPDNFLLLAQVQQVAWQAEEWETVHSAITALLRQHPHARTFYNLGVFYAQFELFDEAVESLRQAILLHPQYGRAQVTMAALMAEQGQFDAARGLLEAVLTEGYDSSLQEEAQQLLVRIAEVEGGQK
ncbi:MAG TPA: tetratricopeptide repeat protein [Bacilli bacterium]|nr:tetratricopeptide repeat protein [Bacilli bacterium]